MKVNDLSGCVYLQYSVDLWSSSSHKTEFNLSFL